MAKEPETSTLAGDPREETVGLQDAEEAQDEISRALGELGKSGTVQVRVYRFDETGSVRDWAMCAKIAGSEFDPWSVVENFGPGRYRFEFVLDGRMRKRVERRFAAPKNAETITRQPIAGPIVPGNTDVLSLLLERMKASEAFSQQLVLAMIGNLGKSSGAGISASDLLAAIREGREQATAATAAPLPHETIIQAIQTGLDFAGRMEPSNGGGSILKDFGPKILDLVGDIVRRTPPPAPSAPRMVHAAPAPIAGPGALSAGPAPIANPPNNQISAPGPALTSADLLRAFLLTHKASLLEDAAKGRNGYMLGAFFAERVPDSYLDPLYELAAAPVETRKAFLMETDPELGSISVWFEDVAKGILDSITSEAADSEGPESAPDSAPDNADRHDPER